jgi:hypothetical protein
MQQNDTTLVYWSVLNTRPTVHIEYRPLYIISADASMTYVGVYSLHVQAMNEDIPYSFYAS